MDPNCSNPHVDRIFRAVADLAVGGKLSGAGGGGFMGIMARDGDAPQLLRERLAGYGQDVVVYDWQLWDGK